MYMEQMTEDIKTYIQENGIDTTDRDAAAERLQDELFTADSVTGNGSGSYTFSTEKAKENVLGDPDAEDYIRELIADWCLDEKTLAQHLFDWEYWDVSIRCYLLPQAIDAALDELTDEA